MQALFNNIKGDRLIWAIAALLAIFSFLPVYSAASNLAYISGDGDTFNYFIKHFLHLFLGFTIMYGVHKVPYRYFRGLSMVMIPVILVLLLITMFQSSASENLANAKRWISVPFVGFTFQPSTLASVVLMVYVARYLSKIKDKQVIFKETILPLWLPVFLVLALILPANFSTAAIMFTMVIALTFLGGYPIKYLSLILITGIAAFSIFILVARAFPDVMPNRVDTWMNRVENFTNGEDTEAR